MADLNEILRRIHQVADFLYLCGMNGVRRDAIRHLGITCIVNCTIDFPNLPLRDVEFVNVKVDDSLYSSIASFFDDTADRIEHHRRRGGKILVHCAAGISRSASIVLAYLVKYQNLSLREAYFLVKKARPIASPNSGFWKQLIEYEYAQRKETSVKMVPTSFGFLPDIERDEIMPMSWVEAKRTHRL